MIALTKKQMVQVISPFSTKHPTLHRIWCQFAVPQHFKKLKPGMVKMSSTLHKYSKDVHLCVASSVLDYTDKVKDLVELFI